MGHLVRRVVGFLVLLPIFAGYLGCASESGGGNKTNPDSTAPQTDTNPGTDATDGPLKPPDSGSPTDTPRNDARTNLPDINDTPFDDQPFLDDAADGMEFPDGKTEELDTIAFDVLSDIHEVAGEMDVDHSEDGAANNDFSIEPDLEIVADLAMPSDIADEEVQPTEDTQLVLDTTSIPDVGPDNDTEEDTAFAPMPDIEPSDDVVAPPPDSGDPDPPEPVFVNLWPHILPRGSIVTLTLEGEETKKITDIAILNEDLPDSDVSYFTWDATYLNDLEQWRVPVAIAPTATPGPRTLVVQTTTGTATFSVEVDLAPGEMGAAAGSGDVGKTLETVPASAMELFFPVALAWGEGVLFFSDAGWNTLHAYNPGTAPITLANGKFVIPPFHIIRVAGTAISGPSVDGDSLLIPLSEPKGLCYLPETDQGGPLLFFADTTHHQIRVLNLGDTPAVEMGHVVDPGFVVTLAGQPDFGFGGDGGPALNAKFFRPWRVRGCEGPLLLTGDVENYRVRAVNRSNSPVKVGNVTIAPGHVDTIAGTGVLGFSGDGGPANLAQVSIPKGFAVLQSGLIVFSDPENDRIRVINPTDQPTVFAKKTVGPGNVDTIGTPGGLINFETVVAGYNHPTGLRLDEYENLFVADTYSQTLKYHNFTAAPLYRANQWVWPAATPTALAGIEHYKGDYTGVGAGLSMVMADPFTVEYVPERGELYAADVENHVVLRLKLHSPYDVWSGAAGPFPNLPPSSPAQPHVLDTDSGVLSLAGGKAYYFGGGSGVFNFTDIFIPAGATLKLKGQRPAVLLATGAVVIAGSILVESGSLTTGPGVGIGAGGGGHATAGTGTGAGTAYGAATLIPMAGGSAGGSGGAGGGGLLVASLAELTVSGTVSAVGKSGGKPGAGSGGGIRLVSFGPIHVTGTVSATGGSGQGAGAPGRIRIESVGVQNLSGTIKPTPSTATFFSQNPPRIPGI